MRRKITDKLIIVVCIMIVGIFFLKGMMGIGGRGVRAGETTGSPVPSEIKNLVTSTPTPTPVITQTVIATPTPAIISLDASYTGPSVEVGEEYDMKDLAVTITYDDGEQENVTDYTVSSKTVQKTGMNTIIIMYKDLSTKAYVYGRQLLQITVSPKKMEYGIGNMPECSDLKVFGVYSDGSTVEIEDGFDISPEKLEKEGTNEVTVTYKNKEAKCTVLAKKWESVLALNISYNKPQAITNVKIDRKDLTVMAVYSDLSAEKVTTYIIERDTFVDSGKQNLTIVYGGVRKTIEIDVIDRYITGMSAEYTGGRVIVGRNYRQADMHVYLEYVDGGKEEISDYTVHTRKIRYIGDNIISIYYGDKFSTSVIIEGIELTAPDFDYISEVKLGSGKTTIRVKTAIPKYLSTDCMNIEAVKNKLVKKAFRKLKLKKSKHLTFSYEFQNADDELELPLQVRITIPDGYDMEHTYLYYLPNRKTILGRTNKEVITDRTFECTIFKVGTYMLVCSNELVDEAYEE